MSMNEWFLMRDAEWREGSSLANQNEVGFPCVREQTERIRGCGRSEQTRHHKWQIGGGELYDKVLILWNNPTEVNSV